MVVGSTAALLLVGFARLKWFSRVPRCSLPPPPRSTTGSRARRRTFSCTRAARRCCDRHPNAPAAPPKSRRMGYNSWTAVGTGVTEAFLRDTADFFISSGLAAAGYSFVNSDDGWSLGQRDNVTGRLMGDPVKVSLRRQRARRVHSRQGPKIRNLHCIVVRRVLGPPGLALPRSARRRDVCRMGR